MVDKNADMTKIQMLAGSESSAGIILQIKLVLTAKWCVSLAYSVSQDQYRAPPYGAKPLICCNGCREDSSLCKKINLNLRGVRYDL